MRKDIIYKKTEEVGNFGIKFIIELNPRYNPSNQKTRIALFQCICGNSFKASITNIKRGKIKSCRCGIVGFKPHGLSKSKEHLLWSRIKRRCYAKKHISFKHYGGRGIKMYEPWVHNFKAFYDYIVRLPNYGVKGLTLDRTDNDKGYEPGNLRWATWKQQTSNRRKRRKLSTI